MMGIAHGCWSCALLLITFIGCREASEMLSGSNWHEQFDWVAEDYFDNPKVISLCHAIEANDVAGIDAALTQGANVNAKGKAGMTPLLWAFPDAKLDRFKRLLEHGADPNVTVESDFQTRGGIVAGDSVTHLACKTSFPGYFEAVFAHGGDPNLVKNGIISNQTPLFTLIQGSAPSKAEKVRFLAEKGADLNHLGGLDATPSMMAAGTGHYDLALLLLELGADPGIYKPNSNSRLVHIVIGEERRSAYWTPEQKVAYQELVKWLEVHGESFETARADIKRWESWNNATGESRHNLDAEIAARKARETREMNPPR